ncbi:MAG: CvpA family protein [Candidatus Omnitrophota bacterium]
MEILKKFNWTDILVILLVLKCCYTGVRAGLTQELFRLIGTLASILFGFHYFNKAAYFIVEYIKIPLWIIQIIVLAAIVLLFRIAYKYAVALLLKILNVQFVLGLEKAGGAVVGSLRGLLLCGFILITLLLLPIKYISISINKDSVIAPYLVRYTAATYKAIVSVIPFQEPIDIIAAQ